MYFINVYINNVDKMDKLSHIIPDKINQDKVSIYRLIRLYSKYYGGNFIEDIIFRARTINNQNLQDTRNTPNSRWSRFFRRSRVPIPIIDFEYFHASVHGINGYPTINLSINKYPFMKIDTEIHNHQGKWLIPSLELVVDSTRYNEHDYDAAERERLAKRVFMDSYEIMEYICVSNTQCFHYFIDSVAKLCTLSEFLCIFVLLPDYTISTNSYASFLAHALDNGSKSHYCDKSCKSCCIYADIPDTDMVIQSYDGEYIHAHSFILRSNSKMISGMLDNYTDGALPLPFTGNVIRHAVISIYMQKISILNTLCGLEEIEQLLHLLDMACVVDKELVLNSWLSYIVE